MMTQKFKNIAFVGAGEKNEIFDTHSRLNRDNCLLPFRMLRGQLKDRGYLLSTADMLASDDIDIELHLNKCDKVSQAKAYLLCLETEAIWPENSDIEPYEAVFTFDDEKCLKENHYKICYPNDIEAFKKISNRNRSKLICLIAGNKKTTVEEKRELYSERVKSIRWFEKNYPHSFSLYGTGWNGPAMVGERKHFFDKVKFHIPFFDDRNRNKVFFPSYNGIIESKAEVLQRCKFSICYENVRDIPGYVTEKIFDCFINGCVPVYWGANNIYDYIPEDCFIDRRKFKNHRSLYRFLSGMVESEYRGYQERISNYLISSKAKLFGCSNFVDVIANRITI